MRHAIAANSCPFCGNRIFETKEFEIRKSISRVLIKNGLEKEDQINSVVDDIMALASGSVKPEEIAVTQAPPSAAMQAIMASAQPEDDGLTPAERMAPARVLTPGPAPLAQSMTTAGVDPVALAMREFEAAQNLDEKFKREDQEADMAGAGDASELAGIFFMEKTSESDEVERRRQAAAAARLSGGTGQKRTTPAFGRRGA